MSRSLLLALLLFPLVCVAQIPKAYFDAAQEYGIAPELLYAIAVTESARPNHPHPWPWTANISGKAFYFDTRKDLFTRLQHELLAGNDKFDVGLMQINWHWNSGLFDGNLWNATDPYQNVSAGAQFLRKLRDKYGTYNIAVGAYHAGYSPKTGIRKRAYDYSLRVSDALKRLDNGVVSRE